MHVRSIVASLAVLTLMIGCAEEEAPSAEPPRAADTKGAELAAPPLLAWSFEPASADCNGWKVTGAVAIRAIPARTGAYSCKLCADGTADSITLARDLDAIEAGRYTLSAWVRKRAATAAPPAAIARLEAGEGVAAAAPVALREEWDPISTTLDLATSSEKIRVSIGASVAAPNECVFVDDVRVEKTP